MNKKILCILLTIITLISLSSCASEPKVVYVTQPYVQNEQSPAVTTTEATTVETTVATTTTKKVTLDDIGASFIGCALDDVVRAFKDANRSNIYSYESDNGKKIMVKNNWAVNDYYISDGKIIFICTKFRNDGIIDAAAENAEGISAAIEILRAF